MKLDTVLDQLIDTALDAAIAFVQSLLEERMLPEGLPFLHVVDYESVDPVVQVISSQSLGPNTASLPQIINYFYDIGQTYAVAGNRFEVAHLVIQDPCPADSGTIDSVTIVGGTIDGRSNRWVQPVSISVTGVLVPDGTPHTVYAAEAERDLHPIVSAFFLGQARGGVAPPAA